MFGKHVHRWIETSQAGLCMRCQQIEASGYATAMLADYGKDGVHLSLPYVWTHGRLSKQRLASPPPVCRQRNDAWLYLEFRCVHASPLDHAYDILTWELPVPACQHSLSCRAPGLTSSLEYSMPPNACAHLESKHTLLMS